MGKTQKHYAKCKKPGTKRHMLYDLIYMKYPNRQIHPDRKQIVHCQRLGERENKDKLLNEYSVSFCGDENVLELAGSGGYTI